MKKNVLLVADIRNWAFDNIARNITDNLGNIYDFSIVYMGDYSGRPAEFIAEQFINGSYDIVHCFWRDDVGVILDPYNIYIASNISDLPVNEVVEAICRPILTTSVYDHLHLTGTMIEDRESLFHFVHGYSVSSLVLDKIYKGFTNIPRPNLVITDGVRTDYFKPKQDLRKKTDSSLTIGWVGNSSWGNHSFEDAKGLHTIIKPAIDRLQREGLDIRVDLADSQVQKRTRDEMVDYYNNIDILVCASMHEGTPNPVLEAMSSGVAVITTDVGIVKQALGPLQHNFILSDRSVDKLAEKIRILYHDRTLLQELCKENLVGIEAWDWRFVTKGWHELWSGVSGPTKRQSWYREYSLRERCLALTHAGHRDHEGYGKLVTENNSIKSRMRRSLSDWIYARPRVLKLVNKVRGRKT